jgi:hypothetical protein
VHTRPSGTTTCTTDASPREKRSERGRSVLRRLAQRQAPRAAHQVRVDVVDARLAAAERREHVEQGLERDAGLQTRKRGAQTEGPSTAPGGRSICRLVSRRLCLLLSLLAASAAGLLALGPPLGELLRRTPPMRAPAKDLLDDPAGVLVFARRQIEDEVDRFGLELGIELRIVASPEASDAGELAEAHLAQREAGAWYEGGALVVALALGGRGVSVAASEAVTAAAPADVVQQLVIARTGPFVGQPLGGVALASALTALRDHLMTRAAAGALPLADLVRSRSAVEQVARAGAERAGRCATVARGPGVDATASIEAFVCALAQGAPSADDPLFTAPSRLHLARRPWLPFESRVLAAALDSHRPWSPSVAGDRAALYPSSQASDFPPVLLVRQDGVWRVDLVEMGKTAYSRGGTWHRRNQHGPYWLALGGSPQGALVQNLAPVELWGEDLAAAVTRLEQTQGPLAKTRLAEILLRNLWLPGEALLRWEEALPLAPDDVQLASTYADRAEAAGHPLLGAITLAPFGAPVSQRVAELLLRGGEIGFGTKLLQESFQWRTARERRQRPAPPARRAGHAI